jgi:magnesium-transporting ATPase (P-type)
MQAVEDVMYPRIKEARNIDGNKHYELFTENHEELIKAGEEWTKDTAKSYIGVATLILTITFAAAFTVPGGNNQETGTPIFLHEKIFNMFIIADALSIFISASSILVFIGILTSRYSGRDFLKVLPLKLVLALVLLLLSVCSMMVAFYAALNVILKGNHNGGSRWFLLGPIVALGSVPVFILLVSQLSFIYKILHSTIRNPISSI